MYAPLLALALLGCVERKLIVRTDPPGADVYVDGRQVGNTAEGPVSLPFDFYGTRVVVARKEGYLPARAEVDLDPPWYQLFPLGVFSDLLWPGTIEDVHEPEPLVLERRAAEPEAAELLGERARHFAETGARRP